MWILTVHSGFGSTYEASTPITVIGPFSSAEDVYRYHDELDNRLEAEIPRSIFTNFWSVEIEVPDSIETVDEVIQFIKDEYTV